VCVVAGFVERDKTYVGTIFLCEKYPKRNGVF